MKKTKYCFIFIYALTNESTIKYPEKIRENENFMNTYLTS